jgi:eukaryotic-like serine/threonine-protein kinase
MTDYRAPEGDRERWVRADALFSQALDLPPARRRTFVLSACAQDLELARAVMELLEAADAGADFLEQPGDVLREPLAELFADDADPEVGRRLGAYQVVERIARGGAGTVYLGVRVDGEFEQRVAIKILRPGLDSEDVLRRFRAERQILASLDHPHIARLLDGGATASGRPYMVMEHVAGLPISEFCHGRRLALRDRLRLFVLVTRAVEHAHRALIVHRDIKPSNILVTADGTPRLLDFGIAKLLDPAGEAERTRTAAWPMTPAYASPEQLRGEPVTTATDVYQLGVLLYGLLTGSSPFAADTATARLATLTTDPAHPSTVLARRAAGATRSGGAFVAGEHGSDSVVLERELRGDLDTIVMKCLRVEPEARYPSAEALAHDVENYLALRPLSARPATLAYRTGRLVARRPAAVGAMAAGVLALAVYVGSLQAYAGRLQAERDRAGQAMAFANDARGRALAALHRARAGEARADSERDRAGTALLSALQATGQAESSRLEADAARRLAAAAGARALLERDRAVAGERRTQDALDFTISLFRQPASDGVRRDTLSAAGLLGYAAARVRDALPDDVESRSRLLLTIGEAYGALGAGQPALELLEEALELNRRAYGPADPRTIRLLEQLAGQYHMQLRHVQARAAYMQALQLRRAEQVPDNSAISRNLRGLAVAMRHLAKPDSAMLLLGEAMALVDQETRLEGEIARDLGDLAGVLSGTGDVAGAEAAYLQALRRAHGRDEESMLLRLPLLNSYALLLRRAGRFGEAEPLYREALAHLVALGGTHSANTLQLRQNLAILLQEMGRFDEAETLAQENLAVYLALWSRDSWQAARGIALLADLYERAGRLGEAEEAAREALGINEAVLGETHSYAAFSRLRLASVLQTRNRFPEAEEEMLAALRIVENPRDASGRGAAPEVRAALAAFYMAWGRPERAAAYR